MKFYVAVLIIGASLFMSGFIFENSHAEPQDDELKNCEVMKFTGGSAFGQWYIDVEKKDAGLCYMLVYNSVEGGGFYKHCKIPLDNIETQNDYDWAWHDVPLVDYDSYCKTLQTHQFFVPTIYFSPHKQFFMGVSPEHIVCSERVPVLMKKFSDDSVACVKSETKTKLIERGWGQKIL